MTDKIQEQLLKELQQNNKLLQKNGSIRYAFLRGLVFGLATLIGGTILVTLLLWILSWFEVLPIIGGFFTDFLTFINSNYK